MLRSLMCRSYQRHCQNPSEDNTTLGWGWYDDSEGLNDDDAPGGDLPLCTTDADGTFGSTNPADYVETIVFQYQIQTTLEVTANELTNTQLPELERTLSNLLVPDLFQGSACQASRDRARRLLLLPVAVGNTKQRTTLEVPIGASDLTGLESTPLDTVASGLDGGTCVRCVDRERVSIWEREWTVIFISHTVRRSAQSVVGPNLYRVPIDVMSSMVDSLCMGRRTFVGHNPSPSSSSNFTWIMDM